MKEMEEVDGVKYVLGLESVIGSRVPEEVIPDSIKGILKSDKWELLLINSEYKVASDNVNTQIDELNAVLKKYDQKGMLIGRSALHERHDRNNGQRLQSCQSPFPSWLYSSSSPLLKRAFRCRSFL